MLRAWENYLIEEVSWLSTYKAYKHNNPQVLLEMFMMKIRDLSFVPSRALSPILLTWKLRLDNNRITFHVVY